MREGGGFKVGRGGMWGRTGEMEASRLELEASIGACRGGGGFKVGLGGLWGACREGGGFKVRSGDVQ